MIAKKITLEDVEQMQATLYTKARALVAKKGRDYNRKQQNDGDTLFNMRVSTILGVTQTEQQAILVRLADKFMRLASLADASEDEANKEESFEDTIVDIWNYTSYLALFRREQKEHLKTES